eukprot:jgi/Bigna1/136359/aug1.33_g11067
MKLPGAVDSPSGESNSIDISTPTPKTEENVDSTHSFFDLNEDGELDYLDLLYAPVLCFSCMELVVGVGFKSIPLGALLGAVLIIIALNINLAGIVQLHNGLKRFSVDLSEIIVWTTLGYTSCIVLDFLVVGHGLLVSLKTVENDYCGRGRGRCCPFKVNECFVRCSECMSCCLRATFQVILAILGTILLWSTFFIFLSETIAGVLLTAAFIGIEETCEAAIPIARNAVNSTALDIIDYYDTSGLKTAAQSVSSPPFSLGIASNVEQTVADISNQANSYVDAVERLCALFDGMAAASQRIAFGAVLAITAQVIVLIYHVTYFTLWWHENKRTQEKAKRHIDPSEPGYTHPAIQRAIDNAEATKKERILAKLEKIRTKTDMIREFNEIQISRSNSQLVRRRGRRKERKACLEVKMTDSKSSTWASSRCTDGQMTKMKPVNAKPSQICNGNKNCSGNTDSGQKIIPGGENGNLRSSKPLEIEGNATETINHINKAETMRGATDSGILKEDEDNKKQIQPQQDGQNSLQEQTTIEKGKGETAEVTESKKRAAVALLAQKGVAANADDDDLSELA